MREVGPCKVEARITIPAETIDEEFDKRYREIIRTVTFPGFRIGHTPRKLVEKKLGDDIRKDVREEVISQSFQEAVKKHELQPIADPDVDLESIEVEPGKATEYTAVFIVKPTVTVPDYSAISVEAVQPEVTEEDVDRVIERMRRDHAVLTPRAGPLEQGDVAVVSARAVAGDEKILDAENVEYQHPSSYLEGLRIPELPEEILGRAAGEELTLTGRLPDTWPEEALQGKEYELVVKIHEVKGYVLPELDEEFVRGLDYDSVEEMREDVRDHLTAEAARRAREETDRRIVDALIAQAPFDLPEEVVKEAVRHRIEKIQAMERMRGASEEELREKIAEASNAAREEVERDFRATFLLDAIAKKEKILVTEDEVEERIAAMAGGYGRTKEDMEQYLAQHGLLSGLRTGMREEKVMELLRKKVKIEGDA